MKQIIRQNTFETNSSSMHSLVISNNARPYTEDELVFGWTGQKEVDIFEYFRDEDGMFERFPFQVLRTPRQKLAYYIAHYVGFKNDKSKIDEVINLIKKQTKLAKSKIKITTGSRYHKYGWAGVNDTGEDPFDFAEKHNISLEDFILNPKYTIIIDGDEYQEFKELFNAGIIDVNYIEDISSGKDFWDPKVKNVYDHWILSRDEYNTEWREKFIKQVKYLRKIIIEYEKEFTNEEKTTVDKYISLLKKENPDIQIEFSKITF